jgi:transcriptional regulator with XRE-family HTH domain
MENGVTNESDAHFARQVREELARRRMTRQHLADEARISLSTLEKALSGQRSLTLATRIRVRNALGLAEPAQAEEAAPAGVAPVALGAYSRAAVRALEGDYLTLRPSFEQPGRIYAYLTAIEWDAARGHLVFTESGRRDAAYAQRGSVSLPHQSGHLYLVTSEQGQYRLAVLGRPTIDGALYGLLTTLYAAGGSQLVPVSTPLAMVPAGADAVLGLVAPGDAAHAGYARHLGRVDGEAFGRLVGFG